MCFICTIYCRKYIKLCKSYNLLTFIPKSTSRNGKATMALDIKKRFESRIGNDPSGQILHLLQMKSVFYTRADLQHPWGIEMPSINNSMMFHLVVSGTFLTRINSKEVKLSAGDFIIIPHGEGHEIKSQTGVAMTQLEDLPIAYVTECYETLSFGGNGDLCELICGAVTFDHPVSGRLIDILPDYIYIESAKSDLTNSLRTLMQLLAEETRQMSIGGEAVITRLADIVVIQALREYLSSQDELDVGWLNALKDKRIGKSLALMHEFPGHNWSVAELAEKVNMSRTSFAQLFRKLVGNTPIEYLTEWRMTVAYKSLLQSDDKILNIALDLGYKSESSFSRAFKKLKGLSPGEVRKNS